MTSGDDNRFRVKPAAPKNRSGPRAQRFTAQVLKAVSKAGARRAGGGASRAGGRPANTFGRGRVAATLAGRGLGANARRVIVKSRFVNLQHAGSHSLTVHLRYIERNGVTRDGAKGQAYGADTDAADLNGFQERGKADRHQFRFIVSTEDGLELDLKGFTRQLMHRVAIDLESRLDWVAVDHWDTDNPHTHIVLNGHTANGEHLVIAPAYMAHGMRQRASEIATEWLGPRPEAEMRHSLLREVGQQRLTSLDRALIRQAGVDGIALTGGGLKDRQRQNILRARLQQLEGMGLAERIDANRWTLKPGLAATLNALGDRQDALDAMRRALKGEQRELVLEVDGKQPVLGRIASKGLADELNDRGYLVVDGIDGRAHYLKLPAGADLGGFSVGAIVEAGTPRQKRAVDRHILFASKDGTYTTAGHAAQLRQAGERDPRATVEIHVRRLEALRRVGVVERIGDGVWKIPVDLPQQARRHDLRKAQGLAIELRSHMPIEQQVRVLGATWLDRQLLDDCKGLAPQGFGARAREAIQQRANFLAEQGLVERRGKRIVPARNLLATLRGRELANAGKTLEAHTGHSFRALKDGQPASGIYRQSIQLASGRFAMLDDGLHFSLVPWKSMIEQWLGQQLSAVVRGSSVTWRLGLQRGPFI